MAYSGFWLVTMSISMAWSFIRGVGVCFRLGLVKRAGLLGYNLSLIGLTLS